MESSSLFLAPHNDDETLFGAYSLLRHSPHVIVCLRSWRMADPNYPGGMRIDYETRELETACAMDVLGCSWEQWTHPDDKPDWEMIAFDLEQLDLRWQPDQIFAPAYEDEGHDQHNALSTLAHEIFAEAQVTYYLTYTAAGKSHSANAVPFEPDWVARKLQAVACYRSQAAHPATQKHFLDYGFREFYA